MQSLKSQQLMKSPIYKNAPVFKQLFYEMIEYSVILKF